MYAATEIRNSIKIEHNTMNEYRNLKALLIPFYIKLASPQGYIDRKIGEIISGHCIVAPGPSENPSPL